MKTPKRIALAMGIIFIASMLLGFTGCGSGPAGLQKIEKQMLADLVDGGKAYVTLESQEMGLDMYYYRGTVTQIIPVGNDGAASVVLEQTAGGVEYGTPAFATYFSNGAAMVDEGDYVEVLYSPDLLEAQAANDSRLSGAKISLLCEKERLDAGEQFHAIGTITQASHPDDYLFTVELADGSTITLETDGFYTLENVGMRNGDNDDQRLVAGDKIEFWGGFYTRSDPEDFQVTMIVKI